SRSPCCSSSTTWASSCASPSAWWRSTSAASSPRARPTRCSATPMSSAHIWEPERGSMLLEVKNLRAGYGQTQVLHGMDFAIEKGSITALLGANGAGKTTTLRALCAMVKASGEIRFEGSRIDGRATEDIVRLGVAHVPDGRGTFLNLTAEENLRLGAYTRRDRSAVETDL